MKKNEKIKFLIKCHLFSSTYFIVFYSPSLIKIPHFSNETVSVLFPQHSFPHLRALRETQKREFGGELFGKYLPVTEK